MKKYLLILAALCLVSFWGCSENPEIDDDPTEQTPGNSDNNDKDDDSEETETPSIKFETADTDTDTEPTIEAEGGEIEVTFTATAEWTAEVTFDETEAEETRAEAWCTVYPESGEAGTATITITAEPNESTEERSATIVILCGEEAVSLTITQPGAEEEEESIPNNEIHYTSSDGNIVELYSGNGAVEYPFGEGVSVISNTYENGQGVITCDGDITTIGEFAFYSCTSLTSITIPDSVTTIEVFALGGCESLTSITIPNSVTEIGNNTFGWCHNLTNITIPNSVETIGTYAFYECTNLTSITIPDSVTTIGSFAFSGCEGLTSITIPNSVTSFGDYAFFNCQNLKSVVLPVNLTTLADDIFHNCHHLNNIVIPDSVTTIGERAFASCTSLTSITIPDSVTTIGDYAFSQCTSLTTVTIPDSVTSFGAGTFFGCENLLSVVLPANLTTLADDIFHNCHSLNNVVIPDSVTTIGARAFALCSSLTSITIPDNVTTIKVAAFGECSKLTSITIPAGVTFIGKEAFWICTGLTAIYCKGAVPAQLPISEYDYTQFKDTNNAPIYVPAESVDVYRTAEGWNQYAIRIKGYDFAKGEEVETDIWPVLKWSKYILSGGSELYEEEGCIRSYYSGLETTILVESNSDWIVEKENPSDNWFSVDQTSFTGPADRTATARYFLNIKIDENTGSTLRKGAIVLKTVPREAGEEPIETRVYLKQASKERVSQVMAENVTINNGTECIQTGIAGGRYDFEVIGNNNELMNFTFVADKYSPMTDAKYEIRYWTSRITGDYDGVPIMSTTPWVNNPFNVDACVMFSLRDNPGTYARIDKSQKHTLSLEINKYEVGNVLYAQIIWLIDGEVIQLGDGTQRGEMITNTGNFVLTYDELCSPNSYIEARGHFTILSYTFTPLVNWDE